MTRIKVTIRDVEGSQPVTDNWLVSIERPVTSRVWKFPDGHSRVISMPQWYWDMYDRLKGWAWLTSDFAAVAYEFALNEAEGQPNFENALRENIKEYIHVCFCNVLGDHVANDNREKSHF